MEPTTDKSPNIDKPIYAVVVLVAGVIGGLILVILVILFCKYCMKKKKDLKRQSAQVFNRANHLPHYTSHRPQYDINSIGQQREKLLPVDGGSTGSSRPPYGRENEYDTRLDRQDKRDLNGHSPRHASRLVNGSSDDHCRRGSTSLDQQCSTPPNGRRVSFLLSGPSPSAFLKAHGRRYTDTDFHHLKMTKIDRSIIDNGVIRQSTMPASYDMTLIENPIQAGSHVFESSSESEHERLQKGSGSDASLGSRKQSQVSVEIHQTPKSDKSESNSRNGTRNNSPKTSTSDPYAGYKHKNQSHSLEVVNPYGRWKHDRKARSCEVGVLDDSTSSQCDSFGSSKTYIYRSDYDYGEASPVLSRKHRYSERENLDCMDDDTLEELDNLHISGSDETETLNGTRKYCDIWSLRATLEEENDEGELSDIFHVEEITSPDEQESSGEKDPLTSYATSFESNTDSVVYETETKSDDGKRASSMTSQYLHPNYEVRRQKYKSILTKRLQNKMDPNSSTDKSFDSFETQDTDGYLSESSRPEMTTTSFESSTTTENTDSTGDSQTHRLQQMKHDSGYKSLETQKPPKLAKKQISFADQDTSIEVEEVPVEISHKADDQEERRIKASHQFDRRSAKTASKKRREFHRERQMIHVYENINEPDTDSKSDQPSGDSFDEPNTPSKVSVFSRFFKSYSSTREKLLKTRDYSIDEKTDAVFKEFIRYDPDLEERVPFTRRSPRSHPRHRLHRKQTDPAALDYSRRSKLSITLRTTSLGSDSSVASSRRISPQDSIEEEYLRLESEVTWDGSSNPPVLNPSLNDNKTAATIHEIPIIKLPTDEESET